MSLYNSVVKMLRPVAAVWHRLEAHGLENVPPPGEGFVLAPNHPHWFGWDAMLIGSVLPEHEIRWVSWSYDGENPGWDTLAKAMGAILYNHRRGFDYDAICRDVLGAGQVVGLFPEGNNNTVRHWGRVRKFLPGIVRLAVMSGCPIVPCSIAGLEEASPILWAKEHDREPISGLIAPPLILPLKVTIRFGAPVRPAMSTDSLGDRAALQAEADRVRHAVVELLKEDRPAAWAGE